MKYLIKREDGFYRVRGECILLTHTIFIEPYDCMCFNIRTGCSYHIVFITSDRQSVFQIKHEF
nr:MAG TPA: hypothetical protein [Caudoviricetes sp.]